MPGFLDEYLIRLGFQTDNAAYQRFNAVLRDAERMVQQRSGSMAGKFLGAQMAIVGSFAAIGAAALGMVDKVASADQDFRLFAMHMYMGKEAARSLKVAMDALGQPLENLTWDRELRERTRQLIEDQRRMAPGGDFDAQMEKVRDIRFQFTRMEVELKYLAMHTVLDFLHALGTGPDDLLAKLRKFNDWVITNMPAISQKITQWFLPIWHDVVDVMKMAGMVAADFATAFTNIIGVLSGDASLQGTTFDVEKLGLAIQKVVHWAALLAEFLLRIAGTLGGTLAGGTVGGLIGTIAGGIAGIPGGPAGIIAGAAGGGALGTGLGSVVGGVSGAAVDLYRYSHPSLPSSITGVPTPTGIPDSLVHALMMVESGGHQTNAFGQTLRSRAGALGRMQLMPGTARDLGVDPNDAAQNMAGGARYIAELLKRYGGNQAAAIGAYNWGPGNMDKFLAGKATMPDETRNEIARVMGQMGQSGTVQIGSMTIHVGKDASPEDVRHAATSGLKDAMDSRTQRNQIEFQSLSYSY